MALFSFQLDKIRWTYGKRSEAISEFPADKAFSSSDERNIKVILGDSRGENRDSRDERKSKRARAKESRVKKCVSGALLFSPH